jgi:alcohol dehydrogenase class IV
MPDRAREASEVIERALRTARCGSSVLWGGSITALSSIVAGRSWTLVTTSGWLRRGVLDRAPGVRAPRIVIAEPRPQLAPFLEVARTTRPSEVIVAIGGGSAIDTAKGLVAFELSGRDASVLVSHAADATPLPPGPAPPLVALPTTAGTGAEFTPWASFWNGHTKRSLDDPRLEPGHVIVDLELAGSMTDEVALASGLDATAHAMESVWNRSHSAEVDELACAALELIFAALPRMRARPRAPGDLAAMQLGAALAGLAMRRTRTAIAHSMSYVLSARFSLPHGLACGFALADIARLNAERAPGRLACIARALGCRDRDLFQVIAAWLSGLGIGALLQRYLKLTDLLPLGAELIDARRGPNNIHPVSADTARALVCAAFSRLTGDSTGTRFERRYLAG